MQSQGRLSSSAGVPVPLVPVARKISLADDVMMTNEAHLWKRAAD